MVVKSSLDGLKVLVTRPEQQAKNLCKLIEQAGGEPIAFPVIKIVAIEREKWAEIDLAQQDMIIFISRNAVTQFTCDENQVLSKSTKLVSIGSGSAESMRKQGLHIDLQPEQGLGSEGLLVLPELENVAGKKIVIVRGKGGRELLAESLKQRGAEVSYLEVYKRELPSPSLLQCEQALATDYLVCTSVAGVKNLTLLLQKGLKNILDKPMLVISERVKKSAVSLGFTRVSVINKAGDNAVIKQLIKMEAV